MCEFIQEFEKIYYKLKDKISESFFLLNQYSDDFSFRLMEVIGRYESEELDLKLVPIEVEKNIKLYLNILFYLFSKLDSEKKSQYYYLIDNLIEDFYKLFFYLDMKEINIINTLIDFYSIEKSKLSNKWMLEIRKVKSIELHDVNNIYLIDIYEFGVKIYKEKRFIKGFYSDLLNEISTDK
nr:hypothetical protein [Clostridium paraputrificum]